MDDDNGDDGDDVGDQKQDINERSNPRPTTVWSNVETDNERISTISAANYSVQCETGVFFFALWYYNIIA